jgi:membrane carboxypeptidase/penicillin-binding protein
MGRRKQNQMALIMTLQRWLKIYTTIDSRMQLHAEEAVTAHIANLQEEVFIQKPIKTHHS